jgi:hypothetical protein
MIAIIAYFKLSLPNSDVLVMQQNALLLLLQYQYYNFSQIYTWDFNSKIPLMTLTSDPVIVSVALGRARTTLL